MAQDISLRGAKVAQGGPNYLQGGSCPPAPYFPRLWKKVDIFLVSSLSNIHTYLADIFPDQQR